MHTLAQAYWGDEQRISDIEALLRRATELAPAHVGAWLLLASLLHTSDRPEEAIACYRRAAELEPGNPGAWSGLAADYAQVGEMEKSAEAYARSLPLSLAPGAPGIHMSYAHVLKTLGRQIANKILNNAFATHPGFNV